MIVICCSRPQLLNLTVREQIKDFTGERGNLIPRLGKVGARLGQGLGQGPGKVGALACPDLARTLLFVRTLPQPCPNLP